MEHAPLVRLLGPRHLSSGILSPSFSDAQLRIVGVPSTSIHFAASLAAGRHCEPTGRANARPMTGSAKQSTSPRAVLWIASLVSQ